MMNSLFDKLCKSLIPGWFFFPRDLIYTSTAIAFCKSDMLPRSCAYRLTAKLDMFVQDQEEQCTLNILDYALALWLG
jgi:hypothetical protein